jgi:hypothetical protein
VAVAVEGCTGWRCVVEEIRAAGLEAHLAEPADTRPAGVASIGPRPIAATPGCCGTCWRPGSCRRAGSHPKACWSGGSGCGCTCRWPPAHGVVSADPRRALPARRGGARGRHPHCGDAVDAGGGGCGVVAGGAPADHGRVSDDRRHRRRGPAAQAGAAAFRGPSAGVSGPGRRPVRHRRVDRGGGVVRTGRLPALLPFGASRTPQRPGRGGGRLRPAPRWGDARKAPRRCAGRCTRRPRTPRTCAAPTTTSTPRSRPATTARSPPSPWPASRPAAATTCCAASSPSRSTRSRPEHHYRPQRPGPFISTSGTPAVSSCNRRARQRPRWTAFKH